MQSKRLYVGNLKYSVTENELKALFESYGQVEESTIIGDKGFGFIQMASSEEALKAKDALDGQDFQGRTMRIDEARPRPVRS